MSEPATKANKEGASEKIAAKTKDTLGTVKAATMGFFFTIVAMITGMFRSIIRPTVWKTAVAVIAIIAIAAVMAVGGGKASMSSINPVDIDAGMFKRYSLRNDDNRVITMTKQLNGDVELTQASKGRLYRADTTSPTPIWRPVK